MRVAFCTVVPEMATEGVTPQVAGLVAFAGVMVTAQVRFTAPVKPFDGGGSTTPAGSSTVTVTATAGTLKQTGTFTVDRAMKSAGADLRSAYNKKAATRQPF